MNSSSRSGPKALIVAMLLAAVVVGWMVSKFDVQWLLAIVLGAIMVGFIFYDYRVGAVCMTVLLPVSWSPLLPQQSGFNVIYFLVVASLTSLFLHRAFGRQRMVGLPRLMIWCYFLPLAVAVLVAWPNLPIGRSNFPTWQGHISFYDPMEYTKLRIIKPLFFVLYALLLANAVRDSKRPEWFLVPCAAAALIPAIWIIYRVAIVGVDVNDRNDFLPELGLQVNEYGALLSAVLGPLLFISSGSGPRKVRWSAGLTLAIVALATTMTASRAAAVAGLVTLAVWLVRRRRWSDLFVIIVVLAILPFVLPSQISDRLTMGFDDLGATHASNSDDPLTQGRVHIWALLLPEFWKNPLFGNGLSSIGWNPAITSGELWAVGHPHSLYITILLDLGLVGGCLLMYLLYRIGRGIRRLGTESSFSPLMRDYFAGAFAGYLAMGSISFTEGYYTGHPEQSFLWCALGFTFAYWALAQKPREKKTRKPFGWGVKSAEALTGAGLQAPAGGANAVAHSQQPASRW